MFIPGQVNRTPAIRLRSKYVVESVSNIRNEMPLVRQDVALTSVSLISNNSRLPLPPDSSLLSTSPQEIQRQLERHREYQDRIHIVV
jgi:hypothetical protein